MSDIAEAFRTGGIWMYLILLLQFAAFPLALVLAGLNFKRFRIPWVLWALVPLLIMVVLSLGNTLGIHDTFAALELATPDMRQKLMARGILLTLNVEVFGGLCVLIISLGSAFLLAVSTLLGTPKPRKFSFVPAGIALTLGVLTAALVLGVALATRANTSTGLGMGVVIFCAALCSALVHTSWPEEDAHAARSASARLGVAALGLLALWGYGNMCTHLSMIELLGALEVARPQDRLEMLAIGFKIIKAERIVCTLGTLGVLGFGLIPALLTLKHALDKRGLISGAIAGIALTGASLISFGLTYSARQEASKRRIPTARWALQAHVSTPTGTLLPDSVPGHDRTPDHDLDRACVLHKQGQTWTLSGVYTKGSVWDKNACKSDPGAACASKPGPLSGPLCKNLDGIGMLVPAQMPASEFIEKPWSDEPRDMLLALDAETPDVHIDAIHPYFLPLLAAPLGGVELTWHPEGTPQSEFSSLLARDDTRNVYVLLTKDGSQEASALEDLDILLEVHHGTGLLSRMVLAPSPSMTMQDIATICLMRSAHLRSDQDPYSSRERAPKTSCLLIGERTAKTWLK